MRHIHRSRFNGQFVACDCVRQRFYLVAGSMLVGLAVLLAAIMPL